jgi:hypothetical protein
MADLWFATRCKAAGVLRVLIDRPDGWLVPLDSEVSIWSAHAGSDDIQTRVAQAAGPWGRDQLRREAAAWPAALDEEWFWPSLGFVSSTEVVLPERTW